jgi:hypothetical protein
MGDCKFGDTTKLKNIWGLPKSRMINIPPDISVIIARKIALFMIRANLAIPRA